MYIYVGTLGEGHKEPRKCLQSPFCFVLKYKNKRKTLGHPEMVPQVKVGQKFLVLLQGPFQRNFHKSEWKTMTCSPTHPQNLYKTWTNFL